MRKGGTVCTYPPPKTNISRFGDSGAGKVVVRWQAAVSTLMRI